MTELKQPHRKEKFTFASLIAIITAVLSFMTGSAILSVIFAATAIITGAFGFLLALSARKRGGVTSVLAILGGLFGVIAAVFKAISWLMN